MKTKRIKEQVSLVASQMPAKIGKVLICVRIAESLSVIKFLVRNYTHYNHRMIVKFLLFKNNVSTFLMLNLYFSIKQYTSKNSIVNFKQILI